MKVFVTGATGYIGRSVVAALLRRCHDIVGLARSTEAAQALSDRGVAPVRGDLDAPEDWAAACASADAVIHLAFQWKPEVASTIEAERRTVSLMLEAARGLERPFVFTSGTSVLGDTGDAVFEEDTSIAPHPLDARLATERLVLHARGVAGCVVRAPNVYGRGDGEALFASLRQAGAALRAVPFATGSDDHLWSFVHVDDLAALFVAVIEQAPAHQLFHAGAQSGLRTREIAHALSLGSGWGGRTREMPLAELRPLFPVAALADYWSQNGQSSRAKAEERLGWRPVHLDMLREIAAAAS